MTRTLLAKPKRFASAAVVASLAAATVGFSAASAYAAAGTTITSSTPSPTYTTAASVPVAYAIGAGNTGPVRYAIVAGSNADTAANGTLVADATCSVPDAAGNGTCTVTVPNAGSSVVRLFIDSTPNNNAIDPGEPTVDVTVVKASTTVVTVTLDKHSSTTSTGGAVTYVATLRDAGGNLIPGAAFHVQATIVATVPGATPTNPLTLGGVAGATGSGANPNWQVDGTDTTDTTGATVGTATFTLASAVPGTVLLRVFKDVNSNNIYDAGEPNDSATQNVVAGGAASVTTVTVTPVTDTRYAGDTHTLNITLTGSGGAAIAGVTPTVQITGPNNAQPVTLSNGGVTDLSGKIVATYPGTFVGTDSVLVFVNQPAGTTINRDPGEPGTTVSRITTTAPAFAPANTTVGCLQAGITGQGTYVPSCIIPVDQKTVKLQAVVKDGTAGGGAPLAGVIVTWSVTTPAAGLATGDTLTASSVTDASGVATATLTIAGTPASGLNPDYVITAKIGATAIGTASIDYQARAAFGSSVAPLDQAVTFHGSPSVVGKVVDQFGTGVAGQSITFSVTGSNLIANTTKTTAADGTAVFTYVDVSTSTVDGHTDTITVTPPVGATTNATVHFYASAAAATVAVDVLTPFDFAAGSNTAAGTPGVANTVKFLVKNAAGTLLSGKSVVVTLTGVGTINGSTATTATVVTDVNGVAMVDVTSNNSGAQVIKATVDGISATGTLTYPAPLGSQARNISVTPITDAKISVLSGDLKNLRFLVTDVFGSPVPGVVVQFDNTGAGFFFGGTNTAQATTNSAGVASVAVTSLASSFGLSTVTASIVGWYNPASPTVLIAGGTQCAAAAGSPAGASAGNCTTSAQIAFGPLPTIGGTTFRVGPGGVTISGIATPGADVGLFVNGVQVAHLTSNATTGAYSFRRTIDITTSFTVKVGGLSSNVFKISVKFGLHVYVKNRVIGAILVTVPVYPHVSNIRVNYYMIVGSTYRYLGHSNTGATGFSGFNVRVARHHTYVFAARAVAGAGRLGSSVARSVAIRSL